MKRNILVSICFFISTLISAQLPEGFIRERIATGLNPTSMVMAPDGRILITEKNGRIRVIRDDHLLDDPMLTLEVDDSNERGLGHIVLHPDFDVNGYFYIFYSVPGLRYNRISRFTANGDKVIPGSELTIMNMDVSNADIHNGGAMIFGIDGYLYVSTGDGAMNGQSENLGSTHGKVLRLDDLGNPVKNNPWFELNIEKSSTVYAYGVRNPFTMCMNPLTGEIYVNDVGLSKFEEVNKVERGAFYGWPRLEGKATGQKLPPEYLDPVFQYAHSDDYCCIVGSTFYYPDTTQFPEIYVGTYFYSDYCSGDIRMLDVETGIDKGVFISDGDRVIDMLVSSEGSFYYLERRGIGDGSTQDNTSTNEGTLWRVSYTGAGKPFLSIQPESVLSSVGEEASFNVKAFGAFPLSYKWFLNGDEVTGEELSTYTIEHVSLEQDSSSLFVIVTNAFGQVASDTAYLYVTNNHRPVATITSPVEGASYQAGSTISFLGFGQDDEDGMIQPSLLSWRIDFQHATHSHPAMSWMTGISGGEWMIPSTGETSPDVWYRIYLRVMDSQGLSSLTYRDIFPQLGNISVNSVPTGLKINLDGAPVQTPYSFQGVHGIKRYITAPLKQVYGDSVYFFEKWNDGVKTANREIKATQEDQFWVGDFKGIPNGRGNGLTAKYYDNIEFSGVPLVTMIDSIVNHQFFSDAPLPSLPADNFGIQWDGYIQAYNSGEYKFIVIVDDGITLEIDGELVVNNWIPGVHYEEGSKYLEAGRLVPVRMKMYDGLYGSQIKLRWSSSDFSEEVIPSSQLFPEDYLTRPNSFGLISIRTLSINELLLYIESYKEVTMDFTAVSVIGQTFISHDVEIHVGKNEVPFDISGLPAGIYFLTGLERISGVKTVERFVKVN